MRKSPPHAYFFQFLSAIYFLLKMNLDGFALEGTKYEDVLFYKLKAGGGKQLHAIGEAKTTSKEKFTLSKLFYNGSSKGAITQLWKQSQNRANVEYILFTNKPIDEKLIDGSLLKIEESSLTDKVKNNKRFRKDFSENCNLDIRKISDFINRIAYEHYSEDELKLQIAEILEGRFDTFKKSKLDSFIVFLNSKYSPSKIILKEELLTRLELINTGTIIYQNALQTIVKEKLHDHEFKLIQDREVIPLSQTKNTDISYTIAELLNKVFSPKNTGKLFGITGEMGIGKSTFALQIIEQYLANLEKHKPLPIFVELRGLKLNQNPSQKSFVKFVKKWIDDQLPDKSKKQDKNENGIGDGTSQFNQNDKMYNTIERLLKIPTLIILDGGDEFKGNFHSLIKLITNLLKNDHKLILTGRTNIFEKINEYPRKDLLKIQKRFTLTEPTLAGIWDDLPKIKDIEDLEKTRKINVKKSSKLKDENDFTKIFKLQTFSDNQVESFISNFQKTTTRKLASLSSVKTMTLKTKGLSEFTFRNPLVLLVLTSLENDLRNISIYYIFKNLSMYLFKWDIIKRKDFIEKLPIDVDSDEYKRDIFNILNFLTLIYQELSSYVLLRKNKNLQNKINHWFQNNQNLENEIHQWFTENKKYIEPFKGFLQQSKDAISIEVTKQRFYIVPDRMYDFFVISQISSLLKTNQIESATRLLLELIHNTDSYESLIQLFKEIFYDELEESRKFSSEVDKMTKSKNFENMKTDDVQEVSCHFQAVTKTLQTTHNYTIQNRLSILIAIILVKNKELSLLNNENLSWYESIVITKEKKVIKLDFSFLKNRFLEKKIKFSSLFPKTAIIEDPNSISVHPIALQNMLRNLNNLTNIENLDLKGNQLTEFPLELEKFRNLTELHLDINQLTELPSELGNLSKLKKLGLYQNQLVNLPSELGNLLELTELHLNINQLTELPSELGNLRKLKILGLYENKLVNLSSELGNLSELTELYLNINQLTELPSELGNLRKLKILALHENKLVNLPSELGSLRKLKILALHENKLVNLPSELGNLCKLKMLRLEKNQLTELPCELGNLRKLKILGLYENKLVNLPSELGNLLELTELYLNINQLTELPCELGNLRKLKILRLEKNQLTELPSELGNLNKLTFLALDENKLVNLPSELGNLSELTELYLNINQLTELPSELGNLNKLTHLALHQNQLVNLPSELGNLNKLTHLALHQNQLVNLPSELGNLNKLTYLALHQNQLVNLPSELGNLLELTELHLNINQLTELPSELGNLRKLKILGLYENKLVNLSSELGNLSELTELYLNINQLTEFPSELGNLRKLKKLRLEKNQLIELPSELGNLRKLTLLTLHQNKLMTLPSELGNLSELTELHLNINQLTEFPSELGNLRKLTLLALNENKLVNLPSELGNLSELTELHLNINQLTELPSELGNLRKLTLLALNENKLVNLPSELGNLSELTELHLNINQLTELPSELAWKPS